MSRKLTAATFALTVAGGVYLMAGAAHASNMGFKLERELPAVRFNITDPNTSFLNLYLHSFPLHNGLGDVADSSFTGPSPSSKCVGDVGLNSPATGDGLIDTVDVICDLFTDRTQSGNSFAVTHFNRDTCQSETQGSSRGFAGVTFTSPAYPLERDAGMIITVNGTGSPLPRNRGVTVGSHDPSYAGRQIRQPSPDCVPRLDIIAVPYHTMYETANELLCGLEGLDWVDVAPADGNPDTCNMAIFDGTHGIGVGTFDNVNDSGGTGDNATAYRNVTYSVILGRNVFSGPNYPLAPGEAYFVSISPAHVTSTFISPHF